MQQLHKGGGECEECRGASIISVPGVTIMTSVGMRNKSNRKRSKEGLLQLVVGQPTSVRRRRGIDAIGLVRKAKKGSKKGFKESRMRHI